MPTVMVFILGTGVTDGRLFHANVPFGRSPSGAEGPSASSGLGPEQFPIEAFVGMISDEVEHLRELGNSDEEIALLIEANSNIKITASEIVEHYAPPEERRRDKPPASTKGLSESTIDCVEHATSSSVR